MACQSDTWDEKCEIEKWQEKSGVKAHSFFQMDDVLTVADKIFDSPYGIFLSVIAIFFLYLLYKAYWNPIFVVKDLSAFGFDHIPGIKSKDSPHHIARAQRTRSLRNSPPPYPNGWYALAESRAVKIGDVTAVDALGHNFCVFRGEDGEARIVDAYCPHLGANIGVGGAVRGNCVECPFHKWRFGGDGACTFIPGAKTIPKEASLKSWHTMEVDEGIWVWYDAEGRPPLWRVAELESAKTWGYRGGSEFLISTHIRDIPENASDAAHLDAVHSPAFFTDIAKKFPILNNIVGYHKWQTVWAPTEESHIAMMSMVQKYLIFGINFFPLKAEIRQIGPGHVRLTFDTIIGKFFITQSVTPLEPFLQRVVHRVYSPTYNALLTIPVTLMEAMQFERDVIIWNNKCQVPRPVYVRADKPIRAFRDWFQQFFSENSKTTEGLQW